jgi:hypothetical protein
MAKCHATIGKSEEGMVDTHADVGPGMPLGAALAHNDVTGHDGLAAELLDAKALGVGIATVARRAASFFVSHCALLFSQ